MSYTVYMHINKTNGKKYVGFTGQEVAKRWKNGRGYIGTRFYNAITKYGWDSFLHIELMWNLTEIEARKNEIIFINAYKSNKAESGYNLTAGGEGVSGYKPTPEILKKLSESHAGQVPWNKGKNGIYSEETKRKLSEARYNLSEETRKKLSELAKITKNRSVKVICKDTNEIFNSVTECANHLNINRHTLSNWLTGYHKCTHQYKFMYYDKYTALQEVN